MLLTEIRLDFSLVYVNIIGSWSTTNTITNTNMLKPSDNDASDTPHRNPFGQH